MVLREIPLAPKTKTSCKRGRIPTKQTTCWKKCGKTMAWMSHVNATWDFIEVLTNTKLTFGTQILNNLCWNCLLPTTLLRGKRRLNQMMFYVFLWGGIYGGLLLCRGSWSQVRGTHVTPPSTPCQAARWHAHMWYQELIFILLNYCFCWNYLHMFLVGTFALLLTNYIVEGAFKWYRNP